MSRHSTTPMASATQESDRELESETAGNGASIDSDKSKVYSDLSNRETVNHVGWRVGAHAAVHRLGGILGGDAEARLLQSRSLDERAAPSALCVRDAPIVRHLDTNRQMPVVASGMYGKRMPCKDGIEGNRLAPRARDPSNAAATPV